MFTPILKQLLTPVVRNIFDTYGSKMFSPVDLFTTGINGVWYDPSDLTTLYRDSAGTLPVTAVEQPVGLMRDKSGRNNHAFNSSGNSANFPVLSARYNLLTKTEQFDDAVWTKTGSQSPASPAPTFTTYTGTNPLGVTGTIYRFTFPNVTAANGFSLLYQISATPQQAIVSYRNSIYIKRVSGGSQLPLSTESSTTGPTSGGYSTSVMMVTDSWVKYAYNAALTGVIGGNLTQIIGPDGRIPSHLNLGEITVDIWGADLRVANDALNQPAYQRVNTASDYDTVGFKPYLRFNGTNQWLQTNSIDFTYGDKMFVSAGVRKLSDAVVGVVAECSQTVDTNNGSFVLAAPGTVAANYYFGSKGTSLQGTVSPSSYPSPITNVLSGIGNISGDQSISRINGTQAAISTADQGTGNYGNYPIYIGARAGTSLWFNGRLYQMVFAGKQPSAAEITSTETYINQKTGAY